MLDQLETWSKPRLDEPNSFASFSSFLRRFVQTFWLRNFEADLKSSAVLRKARDKLNTTLIIRWNQHTRSQALQQPNLTHFADWTDSTQRRATTSPHNGTREPDQFSIISRDDKAIQVKFFSSSSGQLKE